MAGKKVTVKGFKFEGDEFQLASDEQSMTVPELRAKYDLPEKGIVFILNGHTLSGEAAGRAQIRNGDTVEVARAAKGGSRLVRLTARVA